MEEVFDKNTIEKELRNFFRLLEINSWELSIGNNSYYAFYNKKKQNTLYILKNVHNIENENVKNVIESFSYLHNLQYKNVLSLIKNHDLYDMNKKEIKSRLKLGEKHGRKKPIRNYDGNT